MSQNLVDIADDVFAALARRPADADPWRLHLYLARVGIDHGRRALTALRTGDLSAFEAHLLAYGRICRGLIQCGYWQPDAATAVTWGQFCA